MVERDPHKVRKRTGIRAAAGFTLLEMLVAVTLLALIAALLTGSLRFGVRVWETGERFDEETRVAAVQRLVYQWIHESRQMRMPGTGADTLRGVFAGDAQQVRLLEVRDGVGLPGGYYVTEIYLDHGEDDTAAVMLRRRLVQTDAQGVRDDRPEVQEGAERVLLEGVVRMEIAYYGRETAADPWVWLDSWQNRLDLPRMVKVRLWFADGDRRRWPDLVVPLAFAEG